MTFGHPDDARRIINIDETHHPFSNESDKGGTRANRWAASFLTRSGDRTVKNGRHTTGCYATNAFGERCPPLYILDSKAKYPNNYKIDPRVGIGLPCGHGQFGGTVTRSVHSFLAVRRKGGMDTSLWEMVLSELLLPLYPNTSRTVERCPVTDKILRGPLIVKTDAGPGRLCKEAASWEFRERMWRNGVFIILGLPNGTAVNQELDQGFATFQPAVQRSTQRVVSIKLADRVLARKKARLAKQEKLASNDEMNLRAELMNLRAELEDLDDLLDVDNSDEEGADDTMLVEEGCPEDVDAPGDEFDGVTTEQDHTLLYKNSVMNVGLGNLDLGHMVNGYPGDPIKLRPYDYTFTRASILKWWRKVGFLPMTRNALNDPKVRLEIGEGGAPEHESKRLALLETAYREGAAGLERMGYNGIDTFDIELPIAEPKFDLSEEQKIEELMKEGHMKAGKMIKCGVTMVNAGVAVEAWKRRNTQIREEKEEKEREEQMAGLDVQETALLYYDNWVKTGKPRDDKKDKIKLGTKASKAIIKALMPREDPTNKVTDYTSAMYRCVDWLEGLDDWEAAMEKMRDDYSRDTVTCHKRLW